MKLIDKDAVVTEIERLKDSLSPNFYEYDYDAAEVELLEKIEKFLDTLEVKEVDLDNFIKEEFNKYSCVDGYGQLSVSYNMAEFYGMIKRLTKAQKGK